MLSAFIELHRFFSQHEITCTATEITITLPDEQSYRTLLTVLQKEFAHVQWFDGEKSQFPYGPFLIAGFRVNIVRPNPARVT